MRRRAGTVAVVERRPERIGDPALYGLGRGERNSRGLHGRTLWGFLRLPRWHLLHISSLRLLVQLGQRTDSRPSLFYPIRHHKALRESQDRLERAGNVAERRMPRCLGWTGD